MNVNKFDQQVQNMQQRLAQLQQIMDSSCLQQPDLEVTTAIFNELNTALEELRQQNEELEIAHQTLEAQSQHYQDLFEFAPDGYQILFERNPHPMWVYDTETLNFLAVNEAAIYHYGYSQEEFLALTIKDICPPENVPLLLKKILTLNIRLNESGIWKHLKKDGTIIDVEITSNSLTFAGKNARLVLANDISDRQHQKELLRESEERFRLMADTAPVLLWMSGTDARCTYCNKLWLDFTGQNLEPEICGWAKGIHPEDSQRCLETYLLAFHTRQKFSTEYRLMRADGQYRWILDTGVPRFNAHGSFDGYIGSCIDITDQKQVEKALIQRESYLAAMVEAQRRLLADHDCGNNYTEILELLGVASGASRIYLFENHWDVANRLLMSQRAEWCDSGIHPHINNPNLQNLSYDEFFPRWAETLAQGEIIAGIVEEFPESERFILEAQGILSILILPLIVHGQFFGFIGFDNCIAARPWEASAVDLLRAAAAAISLAQERKQAEIALQKAKDGLRIRVQERTLELCDTIDQLWHEIASRQQVEDALRESEKRFRFLAENSTDMISRHTPEGIFLYVSPACTTLLGYKPEEMVGISAYEFYHPDDVVAIAQTHQKTLNLSDTHTSTYRIRHKDGYYIWFESTFHSVWNEQTGVVKEIHVASRDITQRKQTEETNALLATAVEQAADAIEITDAEARLLYVNPAFEKITGYTSAEVLNNTSASLIRGLDNADSFSESIWDTISQGQVWSGYLIGKRKDGSFYDQEATISPVHNTIGVITHYVAVKRDITERKQVEADIRRTLEKAQELSELKSRFISTTSHEFRTPLTIILSSAQLLQDYGHKWADDKKLTHLQRIIIGGKRMTQLLDDILLLGKADAGKLQCQPVALNLTEFCRDLVTDLQLSDNGRHTITFISSHDCPYTCMDEKLLQCIFSNLLSNALKYSPQGSTVRFELTYSNELAVIQVQDQGIGIPFADQSQMFVSFNRGSNVGTISGTGLGLALVKKCVDLQGGDIIVNSQVDEGTLFIVTLPLMQERIDV